MPGQPLITQTYIRSLSELQPFFNTLCQANQSDASFTTSSQSGTGTKTSSKRTQKIGQTSEHGKTLPKSKSAPVFDKYMQNSGEETQLPSPQKGTRQYIEYLLDRDFLEPLPLWWTHSQTWQGHEMDFVKQKSLMSSLYTDLRIN